MAAAGGNRRSSSLGIATVVILCIVIFSLFSVYSISSHTTESREADQQSPPATSVSPLKLTSVPETPSLRDVAIETAGMRPAATEAAPVSGDLSQLQQDKKVKIPVTPKGISSKVTTPPSNLLETNPQLHAVTYASHGGRDDRFCRAVESAIRHEIPLIILGWGVKWTGLSQKLDAAMRFASELPPDDIIMFTDAFDVMFTNSPSQILTEYSALNGDIIFAGECGCWPHVTIDHGKPCFDSYPPSPTPYRYLNSGTWIAHAKSAVKMLQAVVEEAGNDFTNANDQKLVADMFMAHRYEIQLDYHAKLFQSMHMTFDRPLAYCNPKEDIEVVQGRFYNKRTKSYPSVFHFNGGGKAHHLGMENQLWYKGAQYQTAKEKLKLAKTVLSIPLKEDKGRTIEFQDLCPGYVKI
jgi:hypothetical protein